MYLHNVNHKNKSFRSIDKVVCTVAEYKTLIKVKAWNALHMYICLLFAVLWNKTYVHHLHDIYVYSL